MKKTLITFILFLLVTITWGTTWIAMKLAVQTIPPLFATGSRFLLISPILLFLSLYNKKPLIFPKGLKKLQIFISIFYFIIPFSLMLYSGYYVDSSISAIIFSTMPIIILLCSCIFLKKKINKIQITGLIISLISLFIMITKEILKGGKFQLIGIISLMLAAISHSCVYIKCKQKCKNISIITFNTLSSLLSGILLILTSLLFEHPIIKNFSLLSIISIIYLSIFSGLCGILSYFYLQKIVNSFNASIVFLIFPIIACIIENYIYRTSFSVHKFSQIFPLFLGILITLIPKKFYKKIIKI
ncbi:DMT family transporter [Buchnera aphidicola (Taiwanaphis decaspermi)]|uniref:DMT family transporter n=1 Tax=Buchnera aphidicola TaxID=9 RepID=UPI0031B80496